MDQFGADTEVYDGARGRTRTEPVQVWMPDGSIRALSVYVGIDADADPALATLARAGTLHHIADGVDLAIPFVYHVPSARLMLLVVPDGLRHRALTLRAEHLAQLAADAGHALPEYAREAELVVGHDGLLARLEGRGRNASLQALGDGQDVRALLARERDLMRRERLVRARERAMRLSEREQALKLATLEQVPPLALAGTVDDSELEEIEDLDTDVDAAYEPALVDGELPLSGELELDTVVDAEGEPVEAEELTEASYAVADDTPAGDDASEAEPVDALEEVEDIEPSDAVEDEVDELLLQASASAFAEETEAELWLTEQDGRVFLFVRPPPRASRDVTELDLLLQLDPSAEVPVALLTLVFDADGALELRRGAVDPNDPAQVRALTQLAEHFEVQLVSELEPWARLAAPREANARAVLGRLTRKVEQDPDAFCAAREELLRVPPPWRELSHPFQPRQKLQLARTATEAAVQLDELGAWLKPERRERLRLLWSVPDERIDEQTAQGLGAALDWGLSLPETLAARAIELGLAHDRRGLLERRIQGLCRATRAPDDSGLEEAVLRAQWSEALEQAARLGVVLTAEAHELAQQHAGESAVVHAEALADETSAVPAQVRERALAGDVGALEELLAHGGYRDLVAGCRVLAGSGATPEAAGRLFALVARRDDPAAVDALLSLLGADEPPRVRVGAALALAQRRGLSAIEEIAANLGREAAPAWRLFALALARYGGGSFRAVVRALAAHKVEPERVIVVLALLCCHGARAQVRARARAADAGEAQLAERALALAADCKSDEQLLIALEEGAELTVFCRIFDRSSAAVSV